MGQAAADTITKKELRQQKKQLKIDQGKLMFVPVAGPSYTPELGFTLVGGGVLSYKTNPKDSLIQRSVSPIILGTSFTGAIFFSTIISTYWMKDKLRINADIWFKDMPDNYWGVGYENGYNKPKSDSTTAYKRLWWWFNPRFLWQIKPDYFIGLNVDYNYTGVSEPSIGVSEDPDFTKYGPENMNSGFGIIARYDSRDVPVNAYTGSYIDLRSTFYSPAFGGDNSYQVYQLDFRQYFQISRRGKTVALQFKTRIGVGDIPYGEMSQLGTPFDLRGYIWGRYRDKSMLIFLGEYRHMFEKLSGELRKHGVVAWLGAGSIAQDPSLFEDWLPNFGFGYRFEVQPRMNLRVDFGIGKEANGIYVNFNEAF
ncbi:MAG: BamA/TamA family outer membrane protein [Anaerolineales bacterium]|nr:BamA/TamA family outer membrane protein [Anaerolineales bacterium]